MPEEPHYIKQNDTVADIVRDLVDAFASPVNVTGATIAFSMRPKPGGTVKVDAAAGTVVDGGLGRVKYNLTASNTDTADTFEAEFQVTYSDGAIQTFPNDGYFDVIILDDIG
jgi:hypothetical protein